MKRLLLLTAICFATSAEAAKICASNGKCVSVSSEAQSKLQCVIDFIEAKGIRIASMRGYGPGTVRASLHPSGEALDINQYDRGRTKPTIPRATANAAGSACGVVSGGTWSNDDTGHWNLPQPRSEMSARRKPLAKRRSVPPNPPTLTY